MHREEGDVETNEHQPEGALAPDLVHHAARHLRKPHEQRAQHGEQVDADQHVMNMRDDEIGVGQLQVGGDGGGHHAGDAADDEHGDEADEIEKRRRHRPAARSRSSRPTRTRRSRSGMVMMKEAPEKKASATNGMPVANMWCSHTPKPRIIVVMVPITTGT